MVEIEGNKTFCRLSDANAVTLFCLDRPLNQAYSLPVVGDGR